jgi:hypothetical protein
MAYPRSDGIATSYYVWVPGTLQVMEVTSIDFEDHTRLEDSEGLFHSFIHSCQAAPLYTRKIFRLSVLNVRSLVTSGHLGSI